MFIYCWCAILQMFLSCDLSYSGSLNWNRFIQLLCHSWVYEIWACTLHIFQLFVFLLKNRPNSQNDTKQNILFGWCCCYCFLFHSSFSFIALITFPNQLSDYVSTKSLYSLLTFIATAADVIIVRKITWATNWDYNLFLDLFFCYMLIKCTHVFGGVHIDFYWIKKKTVERGKKDVCKEWWRQMLFTLRQIILIITSH